MFYTYESVIGEPMRLNAAKPFHTFNEAKAYCRHRVGELAALGYEIMDFNGLDWLWYAVKLHSGYDKGICLQVLSDPQPEEQDHLHIS